MIPAELQQPILDRAGGNPLYAEEFVRLLKDQDLLVETGASWELREGAEVPFPDSVQALIAARLDTLAPDAKSMLADAAVDRQGLLGGRRRRDGRARPRRRSPTTLRELSRKELVRPARRSSIEGEAEYAFWHVLARDVAYGQLPRASRASRHVAAAALDRVEGPRPGRGPRRRARLPLRDRPRARPRGRAEPSRRPSSRHRRCGSSRLAGERALGLDTAAALASFERALALAPAGHPERAAALARFGEAAFQAGRFAEAAEALEEAIASFRARGDLLAAARAMGTLGSVLYRARRSALGGVARRGAWRCWSRCRLAPSSSARSPSSLAPRRSRARSEAGVAARRAGARARRGARLAAARRAPSASAAWRAATSATRRGSRTSARRSLLATEAGQGREVGVLHNNLGVDALGRRRRRGSAGGDARRDRLCARPRARRDRRPTSPAARSIRCSTAARSTRRSMWPRRSPTAPRTPTLPRR